MMGEGRTRSSIRMVRIVFGPEALLPVISASCAAMMCSRSRSIIWPGAEASLPAARQHVAATTGFAGWQSYAHTSDTSSGPANICGAPAVGGAAAPGGGRRPAASIGPAAALISACGLF
jgi:hypothetical protein